MKKIFNNTGMTLVEVIVATVILGIIAAPILTALMQTTQTNLNTEIELKMGNAIQETLETIKATGNIPSAVMFDKGFNKTTDSAMEYYTLSVNSDSNDINTSDEYERWDFQVELSGSGATPEVSVFKNDAQRESTTYGMKRFSYIPVTGALKPQADSMSFEFLGQLDSVSTQKYRYTCKIPGVSPYEESFDPLYAATSGIKGNGWVANHLDGTNTVADDNLIVMNLINGNTNENMNEFKIDIQNKSIYDSYTNSTTNTLSIVNNAIKYNKNVIVNIFNDSPKIKVTSESGYVDVNRTKAGVIPKVINGKKVQIVVKNKKTDKEVRQFSTVIPNK